MRIREKRRARAPNPSFLGGVGRAPGREEEETNMSLRKFSWYLTPVLSVILALPTLLGILAAWTLVIYEIIIRDTKGTLLLSLWNSLPSSLFTFLVLYTVFGPLLACALCAGQFARSRDAYALADRAGSPLHRLTRVVFLLAIVSVCLLVISVGIAFTMRGST